LQSIYDSFRHYWTGLNAAATVLVEFDIFCSQVARAFQYACGWKGKDVQARLVLNDMSKAFTGVMR
jgi:hypothetical protein